MPVCSNSSLWTPTWASFREQQKDDVNIKSIRGDDFLAEQLVSMANDNEKFSMEHVVNDRSAYLHGITYLLDVHHDLKGFHYGLETIMAERFNI